jgi:conjugative relaxase-like TrwC/TraI family protein
MLSISDPMRGSGKGNYYLELSREDYYLEGGEPLGKWRGQGAEAFGLSGVVTKEDLRSLLKGYSPENKKALVKNAGDKHRQSGWDLTFSAPKSVSAAWSQAPPEIRLKIQEAQEQAVTAALAYLEKKAGFSRRGQGGTEIEPGQLTFAVFEHGTSRAQEPQIHTHCVLLNVATRNDGTTGTVRSRDVFQHKMAAGAVFRAQLAFLLREIGFEIEITKEDRNVNFEVVGVSKSLCDTFSTRSKEVKEALREAGKSGPIAAKIAVLETRAVKEHVAREALFERWHATGQEHKFTAKELCALLERNGQKQEKGAKLSPEVLVKETLSQITEHDNVFAEQKLVRLVAEKAPALGISAEGLLSAIETKISAGEIVLAGTVDGQKIFSTKEMLALEQSLLNQVREGQKDTSHLVSAPMNLAIQEFYSGSNLSEEQKKAITHITTTPGSIKMVSGMAGTGKSTMLDVARQVWEAEGYRVIGAALSGKAACGLEESAHIPSTTIAKAIRDLDTKGLLGLHVEKQKNFPAAPNWSPFSKIKVPKLAFDLGAVRLNAKTILVIDEAAMVDTALMKKVVDATQKAGAKLVLVGDERQLQPINAGGPFISMAKILGQATLTDIRRQTESWARDLVKLFAEGRAKEALLKAKELDLFYTGKTHEETQQKLVHHWKVRGVEKPEQNLILAGTNADAQHLNRLAQDERYKAGMLGLFGVKVNGVRIYKGDRILFGANAKSLGVQNGTVGTVLKIDSKIIQAKLDSGKKVTIPLGYYPAEKISLGYAVTTHKAQGMTTQHAYVFLDSIMPDRELSYVQASRARAMTRFFMEESKAGPELSSVARQMERSHQKTLAPSLQEQTREEKTPKEEKQQER